MEFRLDYATRAKQMFGSSELADEVHVLKGDVSDLLDTAKQGLLNASKNRTEALANQINAALNDLGEALSEQEDQVQNLISERPITSLASTFALGAVVGFMLRRH
jgi:ElaB/YqjD/DUF883 family membrane-anchored ribosome-binding protein